MSAAEGQQQHPLSIYIWIWILLFVFSTASYLVDYFQFQGYLRWNLILIFMMLKAGFIVAIFMHMSWERITLITAILVPPVALLFLIVLMSLEGQYTHNMRATFFGLEDAPVVEHHGSKGH
jgi:cytochrome c oxidase subunit IV